jgi:hypothetical protein
MFKPFDSTEAVQLAGEVGRLTVESQMVVAMRVLGMMGLWHLADGEHHQMVSEKADALMASSQAAHREFAQNGSAAGAVLAAIQPLRDKTTANVARLGGTGPRLTL